MRETDLAKACFPVVLQPIFQREGNRRYEEIPQYKAVVNLEDNTVLSVVSRNYRLVTNQEAFELGQRCFQQLFGTVNLDDMEIFNISMPRTKSFCMIDVIHRQHVVNIWGQEVWVPFLRITNSYNRMRALGFDLGFCRKLCNNGMIFEKKTIEYRYYHTTNEIAPEGEFDIDFRKLKDLEKEFVDYMHNLKKYYVPEQYVIPLVCKALDLSFKLDGKKERETYWQWKLENVKNEILRLQEDYFVTLGSNAYSVFNIISDFASRPDAYTPMKNMIDVFQKRAGEWMRSFVKDIDSEDFTFENYLADYLDLAA